MIKVDKMAETKLNELVDKYEGLEATAFSSD